MAITNTKPYFVRALHSWCSDNDLTPYISVRIDEQVQMPTQLTNNQQLVLNIGWEATQNLLIDNDSIRFQARFSGVAHTLIIPMTHVLGIFAKENGQGMGFPPESAPTTDDVTAEADTENTTATTTPRKKQTHLRIVK